MAADRRKKDAKWLLDVAPNGAVSPTDAHLAVLMDLRDELKRLNEIVLELRGVPAAVRTISRKIPPRRSRRR